MSADFLGPQRSSKRESLRTAVQDFYLTPKQQYQSSHVMHTVNGTFSILMSWSRSVASRWWLPFCLAWAGRYVVACWWWEAITSNSARSDCLLGSRHHTAITASFSRPHSAQQYMPSHSDSVMRALCAVCISAASPNYTSFTMNIENIADGFKAGKSSKDFQCIMHSPQNIMNTSLVYHY